MFERHLLREKPKAYQRQLFAAKSEVRVADQCAPFLNEAKARADANAPWQTIEAEPAIRYPMR